MKKKILVTIGIIITILFVLQFYFIGSIKKTPVTPEKFISVLNHYNINSKDVTNDLDQQSKAGILKAIDAGLDYHIGYTQCHNNQIASLLFDRNYEILKNNNIKAGYNTFYDSISFSNNHYQYSSYSTKAGYFVLIQVENTLVSFAVNNQAKNNADTIIKELGYDIGFDINILLAPMMIAGILATLLSLVYIILIFKNNKVNPILALVPFVNFYYICKIADKSGWKMLFFLIPFFNILYYFILMYKLTKRYTDSKLMSLGMGFLPLVLLPAIAFDVPKIEEKSKNIYEEILKEEGID